MEKNCSIKGNVKKNEIAAAFWQKSAKNSITIVSLSSAFGCTSCTLVDSPDGECMMMTYFPLGTSPKLNLPFFAVIALLIADSAWSASTEYRPRNKKLLPAPGEDAGVVTYIQPHLIRRGVIGLAALARRTF